MFLCVFVAFSILAHLCNLPGQDDMGLDATKPVFGVPGKKRLKSVSSARETNKKIEISLVASLDMIPS